MNTQEKAIFNEMMNKAATLSVEELKKVIREDNAQPVLPEVVFDALINTLEGKIKENEFLLFLESLN